MGKWVAALVVGFLALIMLFGGSFGAGLFLLAIAGGLVMWAMSSRRATGGFTDPVAQAMAQRDAVLNDISAQRAPLLEQLKQQETQKARDAIATARARTEDLEGKWL